MKYKVGDKFIIEVTGTDGGSLYQFHINKSMWLSENKLNEFKQVEPPEPVRWIDGAVEQPTGEDAIMLLKQNYKLYPFAIVHIQQASDSNMYSSEVYNKIYANTHLWEECYWLPASDFPMPLPPEPVESKIELCPFCNGKCSVVDGKSSWVFCVSCYYTSPSTSNLPEAIEAHNALCQRLK